MIGLGVLLKPSVENPPHRDQDARKKGPGSGGWFFFGDHFWLPFSKMGRYPWWWRGPACSVGRGGVVQLILRGAVRRPPQKKVKNYARILANNILKAFHHFNFSETSKDPRVSKVFLQCPLDGFPIQPSKNAYQTATGMLWQSRSYQKETETPWNVWFWEMHL